MANTLNAGVYKEEYEARLQWRLNKPTTWRDVTEVKLSNTKIFNWPYMSTEFAVQTGTRGTAYGFSDFALTNDTLDIATTKLVPIFVDRADLAQCDFTRQMEMAERSGDMLNEAIEAGFLATHASWTNFGDLGGGALGLGASPITVTAANIDNIVRGVKREVGTANGQTLADKYGVAFVWRQADKEALEEFAQANGFMLADKALKDGVPNGYYFLDAYHYVSNSHTANHVFGGVRKIVRTGLLKETYGSLVTTEDPNLQSGRGFISRADYGFQVPAGLATIVFDINVA